MKAIILFLGNIGGGEILAMLLSIGFFILIFLALRVFFLWYWKVNIMVENQEKQIDLLRQFVHARGASSPAEGNLSELAEKARKYDEMTKGSNG